MQSKIVITTSAAFLLLMGLAMNFLPQELAGALGLGSAPVVVVLIQVLSAALLGMGYMNWLSKGNPMGGIYSRPLALQNLLLFGVGAISLDRAAVRGALPEIQLAAALFTGFALAFAWLMFFHDPVKDSTKDEPRP